MTEKQDEPLYGIGAVAKLTGLTDHTIRVWERRYGAVVAGRRANGRRVYATSDVEKLGLLKRLTDQGVAIGQIAAEPAERLRERLQGLSELAHRDQPAHVSVALLGDFLPAQVATDSSELAPVELTISDTDRDRFMADLERQPIDVVVFETPVLDEQVQSTLKECRSRAGNAPAVIVYRLGRSRDARQTANSGCILLRSPVTVDELRRAIMTSVTAGTVARSPRRKPTRDDPDWAFEGEIESRRFSAAQLRTLSRHATAIDCECPQHLAQLVADLSAFEIYSASCASRDARDAALHRFLHHTTATVRARLEAALQRVADAEGIEY